MLLREEFEKLGNLLFRWRSYLPLALLPLLVFGLRHFTYIGGNERLDDLWEIFCLAVSFAGLTIRALVVGYAPAGTSGRKNEQRADALNTKGMYSLVRHPLYLGNFFAWLGISLFLHDLWIVLIFILAFLLYYERISFAEEEYLRKKFGSVYLGWAQKTPAFFPRLRRWEKPDLPFSFRSVLRRENSGFFAVIAIFTSLEIFGDLLVEHSFRFDPTWKIIFWASLAFYLLVQVIKKKTSLLKVKGR